MDEKIKKHLEKVNEKKGYSTDEQSLIETILDNRHKAIYEKRVFPRRWWDEYFVVVSIDGMKIGFMNAQTTGDESPEEKGWQFDPATICEVEETQETVTVYTPKEK